MSTNHVPISFRCAKCTQLCTTGQHQTKYQGGRGKKMSLTTCCLAPIGPCCYNPSQGSHPNGDTCLFCPIVSCTTFFWILKRRIDETLCGSNTNTIFEDWDNYLRSMYDYDEWSSAMPRLRDFLIWVARNHPDVTIRWYNLHLKSVRDLYETFKNEQIRKFLSQLFNNQLSLQKSMPLNPQLNNRFLALQVEHLNFFQRISKIFPCAKFIAQSRIQFMKNIAKRFAVERVNEENTLRVRMLLWILKRILTKKIIAIQCVPF